MYESGVYIGITRPRRISVRPASSSVTKRTTEQEPSAYNSGSRVSGFRVRASVVGAPLLDAVQSLGLASVHL